MIPTTRTTGAFTMSSISKENTIQQAMKELESFANPLEATTEDWHYEYHHLQNITQKFPLDLYDIDDLDEEELQLITEYKFLLGNFSADTSPRLTANPDGSHSLRMTYINGDPCEEAGIRRDTAVTFSCGVKDEIVDVSETSVCKYFMHIHSTRLCSLPYFVPFEMQERSPIFCYHSSFSHDTLLFGHEYCRGHENCAWENVIL
jgi:hypothetical protein